MEFGPVINLFLKELIIGFLPHFSRIVVQKNPENSFFLFDLCLIPAYIIAPIKAVNAACRICLCKWSGAISGYKPC